MNRLSENFHKRLRMRLIVFLSCALPLLLLPASIATAQLAEENNVDEVKSFDLGETRNVHSCGKLCLAGQFGASDIDEIKAADIRRIISLRTEGEIEWDEKAAIEAADLEFVHIPFRSSDSLTDEVFDEIRKLLKDDAHGTLMHCASANRVGGVWLPYRVLDQGVALDKAIEEAKSIGLRNEGYEKKALDYIRRKQAEKKDEVRRDGETSVRPGINDGFLDPNLKVDDFVKRFEIESREVYSARMQILRACGIKPGYRVADIGAGTGLYTRLFSGSVGDGGWVYAIDISARFIEHINTQSIRENLSNVTGIICMPDSINLPPESIDLAFVCDTYHHFEYPKSTASSIYRALKPGGRFVVIDFERIPGKSREWIVGHVRAGKEVFRNEIESVGFEFIEQAEISGLEENYFLKFRKR